MRDETAKLSNRQTVPILRRRSHPAFTAFCDGALLLGIFLLAFPFDAWMGMLAALVATLPGWLNIARSRQAALRFFVPDPLAPDFASLSSAFVDSVDAASLKDGTRQEWTLCPFRGTDGVALPYSIDLRPAKNEVVITDGTITKKSKTSALLRPRLPVPITVRDEPVSFSLVPAKTRQQVFIDAPRAFRLPWNRADGNWLRDDVAKLWPALAFVLYTAFPDCALFRPERLVLLTLLAILATIQCARRTA